jgi:hypothetical protein
MMESTVLGLGFPGKAIGGVSGVGSTSGVAVGCAVGMGDISAESAVTTAR